MLLTERMITMENNTVLEYYKRITVITDRLRKGRRIAVLGESKGYMEFLEKYCGITDYIRITTVRKKAGEKLTYIGDIKDQSDEYYIIVPKFTKDLDMQIRLFKNGYDDYEGCFFLNHGKIWIAKGTKDYTDNYGNHVSAPSCEVVLEDYVCNAQINVDESCEFGTDARIVAKTYGGCSVDIGKNCAFEDGVTMTVFSDGEISIGRGTRFVRDTEIIVLGGMRLSVGKDCLFSFEIKIYCGDGHSIFDLVEKKRLNPQIKGSPKNVISIGDHVWVGMRSIILNRTVLGKCDVVGAGSLVKGEYPNNCIVAGTPARVIRKDITWSANSLRENLDGMPESYLMMTEEAGQDDKKE